MQIKTGIVLIPYWVFEALKRHGMAAADCLNYKKISHILSSNDLVLFATLQRCGVEMAGIKDDYCSDNALNVEWRKSLIEGDSVGENEITNVMGLSYDESFKKELAIRLFNPDSRQDQYENACIKYDLSPTASGLVIYPGFFSTATPLQIQLHFVATILSALYVYNEYHEVAGTAWFKRQLELLSV